MATDAEYYTTNFSDVNDHQIVIPVNAAIRIFCFIPRGDLENCKLVCKAWKSAIDFGDKMLSKREIEAVTLSTNKEYSIAFYHGTIKRSFFYRKYFIDRDIDEIEIKQSQKLPEPFEERRFRFPCGSRYPRITDDFAFQPMNQIHHGACKTVRPIVYRNGRIYTKKLFTPPLGYYECLERMLEKCHVQRLIFHAFTFTDLFVEKLFEYKTKEYLADIDAVVIHGCNFRYISPEAFHRLLNGLQAKAFFIENIRYCLPNHIGPSLLEMPSIQQAAIFCFGWAIDRQADMFVVSPIDDKVFMDFAKAIAKSVREAQVFRDPSLLVKRKFFGIALCQATQKFVADYQKIANAHQPVAPHQFGPFDQQNIISQRNPSPIRPFMFQHVLLGDFRCQLQN